MIQSLEIQNFQSHKQSKLELVDGVNVVIGHSDTGKSAIIRALRWLIWNRPTGEEFRSNWDGETTVTIKTDSGKSAHRVRTNKVNGYILGKTEFDAIKTDVPEEIVRFLNMNEINLQQQLDRHFLLTNSPGEVAAHFNRVAHLEQIDVALQRIQSWIRQIEQDTRSNESRLEQLNDELKQFDHLETFETDVEVLEDMQRKLESKKRDEQRLIALIESIEQVTDEIESHSELLKDEKLVNNILELYNRRNDLQTRETSLEGLLHNITTTQEKLSKSQENVLKLEKTFQDNFPDVCPLCGQKVKKL
jgi:exonuclease SbcC